MYKHAHIRKLLGMIVLSTLLSKASTAQEFYDKALNLENWHNGEVVLKTGEVEKGSVNFNYDLNLVQVKKDGKILNYSKSQIDLFRIYSDSKNKKHRTYKSLNLNVGHHLYEVLAEDAEKAFLVSTQVDIKTHSISSYSANPVTGGTSSIDGYYTIERRSEDFYMIQRNGKIDYFGRIIYTRNNKRQANSKLKKKKIIDTLSQFKPNLPKHIRTNRIKLRKREELVSLIHLVMND